MTGSKGDLKSRLGSDVGSRSRTESLEREIRELSNRVGSQGGRKRSTLKVNCKRNRIVLNGIIIRQEGIDPMEVDDALNEEGFEGAAHFSQSEGRIFGISLVDEANFVGKCAAMVREGRKGNDQEGLSIKSDGTFGGGPRKSVIKSRPNVRGGGRDKIGRCVLFLSRIFFVGNGKGAVTNTNMISETELLRRERGRYSWSPVQRAWATA